MINLNIDKTFGLITQSQVNAYEPEVRNAMKMLHEGTGKGSNYLGWLHLPSSTKESELVDIEASVAILRQCKSVVVIGIGGSYLGTKAVVEALHSNFDWLLQKRNNPVIHYAGHLIGEDYLSELCETLAGEKFGIIVISKSGTTTEPAIAFRILKKQLEENIGKEASKDYIVAITDKRHGALLTMAHNEGYKTFVIPNNIGGRYSAFTPGGLLPMAVAGVDIRELMKGASTMELATDERKPFVENMASIYAATRNALYAKGKKIEILANYHSKLHYIGEWWKQLFGESEGKDGKGIFPASVDLTTDLHSMGQWIQDSERTIFETVISIENPVHNMTIPAEEDDFDGLNYLAGKRIDYINKMAELGTQMAHVEGDVPNLKITMPSLNAYYIGQLLYFFEKACAVSGYLLGVNPFNQPGVESYKKNMFALLGKPGYEKEREALESRLK